MTLRSMRSSSPASTATPAPTSAYPATQEAASTPASLPGEHVVVVEAGNSAVHVAYELATDLAIGRRVTPASREPIRVMAQRPLGRDLHFCLRVTGFDRLPPAHAEAPPASPVLDDDRYLQALRESVRLDGRFDTEQGLAWLKSLGL
ncbi:hypothetical protein ACFYUV_50210 [Nonomuraea sp. NPDC003560]|uniref:hypothetical protein n=1 Tax=Nonomuraea sp. NPDC003560 TaxID=3364341 RepID=UPI0036737B4D